MKREYAKLKWVGPDKGRRVNGRPLRVDEVFEVPARDAGYMLTLPNIEAAGPLPESMTPPIPDDVEDMTPEE